MSDSRHHVVFTVEGHRYALPLSAVERVYRAVEIEPLPKAPEIILGVVNVHGRVIPVVNVRRRFRLAEREIEPSDQLVLARTARRPVALVVDTVEGVTEYAEREVTPAGEILPEIGYIDGVAKSEDGLTLIHDLDKFLSLEECDAVEDAMR